MKLQASTLYTPPHHKLKKIKPLAAASLHEVKHWCWWRSHNSSSNDLLGELVSGKTFLVVSLSATTQNVNS